MNPSFHLLRTVLASAVLGLGFVHAADASGGSGAGGGGGSGSTTTVAASTDTDVAGEILVKLRSTAGLGPLLARYPVSLVSRFGARPIYRLKVVGAARVKDVLAAMALDTSVMLAEPNATDRSPEARRSIAWTIGSAQAYAVQWAPQSLHLPEAQQRTLGTGVRIAVLDTGVDATHPLLAGRLLPGFDFVDFDRDPSEVNNGSGAYGHGTHVAGLLATAAPGATIMPLRVLDADGAGNAWVLAEAMLYAIDPDGNPATDDGAHVINLSLGSLSRTRILDTIAQIVGCAPALPDDPVGDRSDPGYNDDALRCTAGNGAVVVAAAGNDASSSLKEYPAAEGAYGLVSIAASNASHQVASFSNNGGWIDFAAPGDAITSALPGGGYGTWSGTSMAAPLAAGTAALVRSLDLAVAPKDVVRRLRDTTASMCGTKMREIDAAAAVANRVPALPVCR